MILALVTGYAVFAYTSGVESRVKLEYSTKPLFIAVRQIPAGTSVSSAIATGAIESKQFPVSSAPSNAIDALDNIDDKLVARYTIQPGQILLEDNFALSASQTGVLVIPEGKVAVSVRVEDAAKVGNFLQPGSKVTIYVNGEAGEAKINRTQVLFQELLVLAVGDQVLSNNSLITNSLVTLAVTPPQAKVLIHASQNFVLYFGLLGAKVQPDLSEPVSSSNVFNP